MNSDIKKPILILLFHLTILTVCLGQSGPILNNYQKGKLAADAGKFQEAVIYFTKSLELVPVAETYLARAKAYNALGDSCNFCKDLLEAGKLENSEARVLYQSKCTRKLTLTKIPDSLNRKYPNILSCEYKYIVCNPVYSRDIMYYNNKKSLIIVSTYYGPDSTYTIVSKLPEFAGGEKARNRFLAENITYPMSATLEGIQGTVYVSFTVDKTGNVTNVKLLQGIGGDCDAEAIRVIQLMPKWIPGTENGQPVDMIFNMPIYFKLQR